MTLIFITILIFLVSLGLLVSAFYFFVEAPAARKRMWARLQAIGESSIHSPRTPEVLVVRKEVLGQTSAIGRLLLKSKLMVRLNLLLRQAAIRTNVFTLFTISAALALSVSLLGMGMNLPVSWWVILMIASASVPLLFIVWKRQRRFSKFEESFPDAIDLLARAVRAGHAFTTGLELISQEIPEPVSGEFAITHEQQNLGVPLTQALQNLTLRIPLPDVRVFVSALQVQHGSGGNLAEILDNLSSVIRERFKIARQIKVFTAQGRLTLYFLTVLSPLAAFLLFLVNPDYIIRLFQDPLGHKALAAAITLQILGYAVIRKIIRIEV